MNRVKGQPSEWEKIHINHISDKMLIGKIFKELLKLNNNNNKILQIIQLKNEQRLG